MSPEKTAPKLNNPKYNYANIIAIGRMGGDGYSSIKATRNKIVVNLNLDLTDLSIDEAIEKMRKTSEDLENVFINECEHLYYDDCSSSLSVCGLRNPTKEEQLRIDEAWAKRDADLIARRKKQKEKELEVSRIREEKDQEEYLRLKERFENER